LFVLDVLSHIQTVGFLPICPVANNFLFGCMLIAVISSVWEVFAYGYDASPAPKNVCVFDLISRHIPIAACAYTIFLS